MFSRKRQSPARARRLGGSASNVTSLTGSAGSRRQAGRRTQPSQPTALGRQRPARASPAGISRDSRAPPFQLAPTRSRLSSAPRRRLPYVFLASPPVPLFSGMWCVRIPGPRGRAGRAHAPRAPPRKTLEDTLRPEPDPRLLVVVVGIPSSNFPPNLSGSVWRAHYAGPNCRGLISACFLSIYPRRGPPC